MRHTRRRLAALAAPVGVALALSACAGGGSGSTSSGGSKDTLTLGMTQDIQTWTQQPSYQGWGADAVFDSLLQCNEKGEGEPSVATAWKVSDDNKSVTVNLREGVKFSDGTDLDAEDVIASLDYDGFQKSRRGVAGHSGEC